MYQWLLLHILRKSASEINVISLDWKSSYVLHKLLDTYLMLHKYYGVRRRHVRCTIIVLFL